MDAEEMSGEGGPHVVDARWTEATAEINFVRFREVDDTSDNSDLPMFPPGVGRGNHFGVMQQVHAHCS